MTQNPTSPLSTANHTLLAEALSVLRELVAHAQNDVFTDAPERQNSVAAAEAAVVQAHQVFDKLERAAWQILEEAQDAFEVLSVARERAANGMWPEPEAIEDFLMWIQDESEIQDHLVASSPKKSDLIYAVALRGLVGELCALGFEPSMPPWQLTLQNAQQEMA